MTPELDRRNFLKLVGVTAIVASCGGASTASPAPSTGGTAKATGRISIYSALNESTNDLLAAKWKGKLVLPDPVKTRGGYIFIATQIFRFNRDEAKAMDYMKKLHTNIRAYIGTSPAAIGEVSGAKAAGAPNCAHDVLTE